MAQADVSIPNLITQVEKTRNDNAESDYSGGISARREKNEQAPHETQETTDNQPSFFQRIFCCFSSADYPIHELAALPMGSPEALLPEQDSHHAKRKCLVLDLDETLVHSSFKPTPNPDFIIPVEIDDHTYNVYVSKRPNVDQFMLEMGKHFEVVVFTASLAKYADPVLDLLDIHKVVKWRLFRDSCTFSRGSYVKDLSRIGRLLKHTLIIDNSEASFIFHPEYAILIGSWFDDMADRELDELTPFLIHLSKCDDVRVPLRQWRNGERNFY